jgi:hypothetical protein
MVQVCLKAGCEPLKWQSQTHTEQSSEQDAIWAPSLLKATPHTVELWPRPREPARAAGQQGGRAGGRGA